MAGSRTTSTLSQHPAAPVPWALSANSSATRNYHSPWADKRDPLITAPGCRRSDNLPLAEEGRLRGSTIRHVIADRARLHRLVDELPETALAPAADVLVRLQSPEEAEAWRLAQLVGPDLDEADRELAAGTAQGMPLDRVEAAMAAPDPDAALDTLVAELEESSPTVRR